MKKPFQNFRFLSAGLALFLFLATTMISAHAHAKAPEEQSHHCAVCQYSHSGPQGLFNAQKNHPIDLKPVYFLPLTESHPDFILFEEIPSIRGPPLAS